jgi:hypothetical protein
MKKLSVRTAVFAAVGLSLAGWARADVEITLPASAVTASTNDGNVPGNTVDGNLATRWSGSGDGAWLQLDLGASRPLARITIGVYRGNERQNVFDVQVAAAPGGPWNTVLSRALTNGTSNAEESFSLGGAEGRYLRYVGFGATLNAGGTSAWNSVTEISVFVPDGVPTPVPTATPTPAITPTVRPTATPTPGGVTQGWTSRSWTYTIHKPYDLALSERFRYADGVWYLWVFRSDRPFEPSGNGARTELRWQNNYRTGNHMFDGDIWVVSPIESTTVIQVFGGVTNATASQIRAFSDGTLRRYNNPVVATNAFGRWTNIKMAHTATSGTGTVRIYANDVLKSTEPDRGNNNHYFKNGVYGPGISARAETRFRNLRYWTR